MQSDSHRFYLELYTSLKLVHGCSAGKSKYACVLSSLFYLFLNIIMAPGAIYGRAVYGNANCCLLCANQRHALGKACEMFSRRSSGVF